MESDLIDNFEELINLYNLFLAILSVDSRSDLVAHNGLYIPSVKKMENPYKVYIQDETEGVNIADIEYLKVSYDMEIELYRNTQLYEIFKKYFTISEGTTDEGVKNILILRKFGQLFRIVAEYVQYDINDPNERGQMEQQYLLRNIYLTDEITDPSDIFMLKKFIIQIGPLLKYIPFLRDIYNPTQNLGSRYMRNYINKTILEANKNINDLLRKLVLAMREANINTINNNNNNNNDFILPTTNATGLGTITETIDTGLNIINIDQNIEQQREEYLNFQNIILEEEQSMGTSLPLSEQINIIEEKINDEEYIIFIKNLTLAVENIIKNEADERDYNILKRGIKTNMENLKIIIRGIPNNLRKAEFINNIIKSNLLEADEINELINFINENIYPQSLYYEHRAGIERGVRITTTAEYMRYERIRNSNIIAAEHVMDVINQTANNNNLENTEEEEDILQNSINNTRGIISSIMEIVRNMEIFEEGILDPNLLALPSAINPKYTGPDFPFNIFDNPNFYNIPGIPNTPVPGIPIPNIPQEGFDFNYITTFRVGEIINQSITAAIYAIYNGLGQIINIDEPVGSNALRDLLTVSIVVYGGSLLMDAIYNNIVSILTVMTAYVVSNNTNNSFFPYIVSGLVSVCYYYNCLEMIGLYTSDPQNNIVKTVEEEKKIINDILVDVNEIDVKEKIIIKEDERIINNKNNIVEEEKKYDPPVVELKDDIVLGYSPIVVTAITGFLSILLFAGNYSNKSMIKYGLGTLLMSVPVLISYYYITGDITTVKNITSPFVTTINLGKSAIAASAEITKQISNTITNYGSYIIPGLGIALILGIGGYIVYQISEGYKNVKYLTQSEIQRHEIKIIND
jgi:hypothetical protein